MATVMIMPRQGQSVESCILTEIAKKKGDTVAMGDVLFAYETDKATFEEVSRVEGTVLEVFWTEGDEVPVLENVMVIGIPGESSAEFVSGGTSGGATNGTMGDRIAPVAISSDGTAAETRPRVNVLDAVPVAVGTPAAVFDTHKTDNGAISAVSPRARALAARLGINGGTIVGSGPGGRVVEADVKAADDGARLSGAARAMADEGMAAPRTGGGLGGMVLGRDMMAPAAAQNVTDAQVASAHNATGGESEVVPLSNMRRLIARAMHASLQNSAQLTHHLSADARRVMELRKKAKAVGWNITINDLVCLAVVRTLGQFPAVNAHFLGEKEGVRRFRGVHLGLAVDTERGLMVPVVRNADRMGVEELAANLRQAAEACRKGSINPDLLASEAASFTVSNLGNYGVEMFTPIVNLPQVAILGVNTIVLRPKDLGGGVYGFVPHMGLSLTYDHRAIDGGEATRFLRQIAVEMESLTTEI